MINSSDMTTVQKIILTIAILLFSAFTFLLILIYFASHQDCIEIKKYESRQMTLNYQNAQKIDIAPINTESSGKSKLDYQQALDKGITPIDILQYTKQNNIELYNIPFDCGIEPYFWQLIEVWAGGIVVMLIIITPIYKIWGAKKENKHKTHSEKIGS